MSRAVPIVIALAATSAVAVAWQARRALEDRRSARPGEAALDEAWSAVKSAPRDARAWAMLGDAQARLEQIGGAEASYRTSVRLPGADASVYGRLGFLLYRAGAQAEALADLRTARSMGADLPMLDFTVAQLSAELERPAPRRERVSSSAPDTREGAPPPGPNVAPTAEAAAIRTSAAPCEVAVERSSRSGSFVIPVAVNGTPASLIVDTGASVTALSTELVARARLVVDHEAPIEAFTAGGPVRFARARVPVLEVAGHVVEDVTVVVCEACGPGGLEGLLGLDVQAALGMELDTRRGRVRFGDCE
jgi:clan AA aspartic protease (TIGR02281 family)